MTLPNKLTVGRIILAPMFFISYFLPHQWPSLNGLSGILILSIFAGIEISDFLDGYLARKYNLVSDLGKVMDPFADVISRVTYFLCFVSSGLMPLWIFLIIIYRELGITFLRMMMISRGVVVAASLWGKLKAITYAISGVLGVLYVSIERFGIFPEILNPLRLSLVIVFYLSAFAAVASFLVYLKAVKK